MQYIITHIISDIINNVKRQDGKNRFNTAVIGNFITIDELEEFGDKSRCGFIWVYGDNIICNFTNGVDYDVDIDSEFDVERFVKAFIDRIDV